MAVTGRTDNARQARSSRLAAFVTQGGHDGCTRG